VALEETCWPAGQLENWNLHPASQLQAPTHLAHGAVPCPAGKLLRQVIVLQQGKARVWPQQRRCRRLTGGCSEQSVGSEHRVGRRDCGSSSKH
jgi:hypothetical protein